ncbi:MAG: hypothetical protein AB7F43_07165 [Bacteriovoracia bacterium]
MQKKTTQVLLGAAVAGMIGAGAMTVFSTPAFAKGGKVHCYGLNSCGGKGACATPGQNECKGKNSCKGKGYLELSKAQCQKKGGTTEAPKS